MADQGFRYGDYRYGRRRYGFASIWNLVSASVIPLTPNGRMIRSRDFNSSLVIPIDNNARLIRSRDFNSSLSLSVTASGRLIRGRDIFGAMLIPMNIVGGVEFFRERRLSAHYTIPFTAVGYANRISYIKSRMVIPFSISGDMFGDKFWDDQVVPTEDWEASAPDTGIWTQQDIPATSWEGEGELGSIWTPVNPSAWN